MILQNDVSKAVQVFSARSCPSCNGKNFSKKNSIQSNPTAESLDYNQMKDSWQQFFKEKVFFSYFECEDCHLFFCPQYFTQETIQKMYSSMSDNTASVPIEVLKRTANSYSEIVEKYSKIGGKTAELGPDIGLFASFCAQKKLYSEFYFIEPNLEVHKSLAQSVSPLPNKVYSNFADYSILEDRSLSNVSMIHVVDHLLDPKSVLEELSKKLEPKGTLFAVVHNRKSLLARFLKKAWPPYCLQHPQLFDPDSLKLLFEKANFKVVTVKRTLSVFPANYLLNHLFYALGFKKLRAPQWMSLSIPLYLGNIAIVAEVK